MRTIEINGIKMEVDERTARTIDSYKVGDPVKVLIKSYGDTYAVHKGVITGFADFRELPSIEVMYVDTSSSDLKFVTLNAKSADTDIAPISEAELVLDQTAIAERMERSIRDAEVKVEDLRRKRDYFLAKFGLAYTPVASVLSGIEAATDSAAE